MSDDVSDESEMILELDHARQFELIARLVEEERTYLTGSGEVLPRAEDDLEHCIEIQKTLGTYEGDQ